MSLNREETQTKVNTDILERSYVKSLVKLLTTKATPLDTFIIFFYHQAKGKERPLAPNSRGNANTSLHIWSNNGDAVCHYK